MPTGALLLLQINADGSRTFDWEAVSIIFSVANSRYVKAVISTDVMPAYGGVTGRYGFAFFYFIVHWTPHASATESHCAAPKSLRMNRGPPWRPHLISARYLYSPSFGSMRRLAPSQTAHTMPLPASIPAPTTRSDCSMPLSLVRTVYTCVPEVCSVTHELGPLPSSQQSMRARVRATGRGASLSMACGSTATSCHHPRLVLVCSYGWATL